jgi:hypothetical protein
MKNKTKTTLLKMDFGEAKFISSKFLNKQLLVIDSVRSPGMVHKFHKATDKLFACASCKKLGKSRTVTVVKGRIIGNKNPEDDHHEACRPIAREAIDVDIDRTVRAEVRRTGKRPREAYAAAVATIPKRFKTSAEQTAVVSLFPTFSHKTTRTTNLAEGWHNGLNTTFGTPHPSAGTFLNWLQGAQYLIQAREIQLNAGRQPKQQSPIYRDLDRRIRHAKLQFGLRSGWIFVDLFPHQQTALEAEISTYLKHAGYLIAGNALNEDPSIVN